MCVLSRRTFDTNSQKVKLSVQDSFRNKLINCNATCERLVFCNVGREDLKFEKCLLIH